MKLVNTNRFFNQSVDETAAYWVMRLDGPDCGPTDRAAFEEWRKVDATHADAYDRARAALGLIDRHIGSIELTDLGEQVFVETRSRQKPRLRWTAGSALAASLVLGAVLLFQYAVGPAPDEALQVAESRFETSVGERSTVVLPDDSTISLNTDTLVKVRFTQDSDVRQILLVRGQAHFDVNKDPRPFEVLAGGRRVVALGTAFDIRIDEKIGVLVTLVEGRVSVQDEQNNTSAEVTNAGPDDHSTTRTVLKTGEQLIARLDSTDEVVLADVEQVVGWRDGRLVFRKDPLSEVIREINRYSQEKIIVDDERLGATIIGGAFEAGSTNKFVTAVEDMLPVKAQRVAADRIALVWIDKTDKKVRSRPQD